MPSLSNLAMIGACVVAALIVCVAVLLRLSSPASGEGSSSRRLDPKSNQRLRAHLATRSDYRVRVGVPLSDPGEWAEVLRYEGESVTVQGVGIVPVANIKAFVVEYPNGQLLDTNGCGLKLPADVIGLSPSNREEQDILQPGDLESGKKWIDVTYGPSAARPRQRDYYSTTLTNLSNLRIRVVRFGGYALTRRGWELFTVTNQFYSAEEFQAWYGMTRTQWIQPGESVTDPDNYGSPRALWAYYCEAETGERFVAGGVLE